MLASYLTALAASLALDPAAVTSTTDVHGRHTISVPVALIADPVAFITAHEATLKSISWGVHATHHIEAGSHHLLLMPHSRL